MKNDSRVVARDAEAKTKKHRLSYIALVFYVFESEVELYYR
jgi:hypothetical protein